jgi:hypothetical protein
MGLLVDQNWTAAGVIFGAESRPRIEELNPGFSTNVNFSFFIKLL